jgi:hypothetical protein
VLSVCLSLLLYCMSICLSVLLSVSVVFTHSEIEPSAACHNVLRLMVCRHSPARTKQNHPTTPANVEHILLSPKHREVTINHERLTSPLSHTTPHHTAPHTAGPRFGGGDVWGNYGQSGRLQVSWSSDGQGSTGPSQNWSAHSDNVIRTNSNSADLLL